MFAPFGSTADADTLAVLVSGAADVGITSMVTVAVAPFATVPRLHD